MMEDFVAWQTRWSQLLAEFNEWQGRWRELETGFATSQAKWNELGQDVTDELGALQRDARAFPMEMQRQALRWLAPFLGGSSETPTE